MAAGHALVMWVGEEVVADGRPQTCCSSREGTQTCCIDSIAGLFYAAIAQSETVFIGELIFTGRIGFGAKPTTTRPTRARGGTRLPALGRSDEGPRAGAPPQRGLAGGRLGLYSLLGSLCL